MSEMSDIGDSIQRTLRKLVWATVAMYVALAGGGFAAYLNASSQREAIAAVVDSTTQSLCTLRHDLERRVQDSIDFLRDHPDGIPGIPAPLIQKSIGDQQRTIDALSPLRCPPFDLTLSVAP